MPWLREIRNTLRLSNTHPCFRQVSFCSSGWKNKDKPVGTEGAERGKKEGGMDDLLTFYVDFLLTFYVDFLLTFYEK